MTKTIQERAREFAVDWVNLDLETNPQGRTALVEKYFQEVHTQAVEETKSKIYGRLNQMKSVYETMDTGSALIALMDADIALTNKQNV